MTDEEPPFRSRGMPLAARIAFMVTAAVAVLAILSMILLALLT